MAGGKLPPRQKMINMMYLVLTALLALNVSKEILKAFHLVENSMEKSGLNIDAKNQLTMKAFQASYEKDPKKTKDAYDKAKQVVKVSDAAVKYIEDIKAELEKLTGGRDPETGELKQPDNIEVHANYLINQKNATKLKAKINETRDKLVGFVPKKDQKLIKTELNTPDPSGAQTWESELFEHPPLAAVMTLLSKLQNDVKNTEAQVLDYLINTIGASDFKFDKLEARVIASSTNVMVGQEYEADIFVAASSSTQDNEVLVGGKPIPLEGGMGKLKIPVTSPGDFDYEGVINVKDPSGGIKPYPFKGTYTAYKPAATISADAMNVLYIGLDNPISVSVPGATPDKISAVASSGGKLTGSRGKYIATVTKGTKKVKITASVKDKDGKSKTMGFQEYRVKRVPAPIPSLGGKSSGSITTSAVKANPNILCKLDGFVFEGVAYRVTQFSVAYTPKKGGSEIEAINVRGFRLPSKITSAVKRAKTGDKILVWDIKATAMGTKIGTIRLKSGITLRIK